MKKLLFLSLFGILLLSGCSINGDATQTGDESVDMTVREISASTDTVSEMLDEVKSAVVGISAEDETGFSVGSGVSILNGNYILTNFHVIQDGNDITLYYADKTTGKGEVVYGVPSLDIAILKSSRQIPYLRAKYLDDVSVGDDVYAIGTPLTLQFKHTITKGIVSAMNRTLEVDSTYGSNFLQSLIQHDASINPGNSGGPLVDNNGQVIGLNTLKATEGEGIGFAIPIEVAEILLGQVIADPNYVVPYIGIFGFDSDIASIYDQNVKVDGVYIVSTQGPASNAGLLKGDIITSLDSTKIETMLDLRKQLYKHKTGDSVTITFIRSGQTYSVNLILG